MQFHSDWGSCKDIISCLGKGSTFSLTEMVLFSFSLFSVYFGPAFLGLPKCVTIMRLQYMHHLHVLLQAVPLRFISICPGIKRFCLSKVRAIWPSNSLWDTIAGDFLFYAVIVCVLPCILQSCMRSPKCLCHEVEISWMCSGALPICVLPSLFIQQPWSLLCRVLLLKNKSP